MDCPITSHSNIMGVCVISILGEICNFLVMSFEVNVLVHLVQYLLKYSLIRQEVA